MRLHLALICGLIASPLGGCYGLYGHDEMDRYAQRADVITMSAGDAKEVNARTHMLTPWPPYVGDRRIPMEGSRAVRAIECYRQAAAAQGSGSGGSQTAGVGQQVNLTVNTGAPSSPAQGQTKC